MATNLSDLRGRIGPGLLFAAAAVGTSHVVQSTRAGAAFGLTLGFLIILICLLKYPLFRFAADYAAVTGESLIRGFGRRGRWLVWLMFMTSAIEAVAATAGISLVSAAILQWILGTQFDPAAAAAVLLVGTAALVTVGRYRVLESLATVLVIAFSLLTVIATLASLPALFSGTTPAVAPIPLTADNASFAIAVSGWMPIGNTAAMMLAAWILANRDAARGATFSPEHQLASARFDFNLGYLVSAVLALCFLLIGAAVMHGRGETMPNGSAQFVAAFVGLYVSAIGKWSELLVSVAALAVMYSTMLAIVDGFPRMMGEFADELGWRPSRREDRAADLLPMLAVVGPACLTLLVFLGSFAAFVDLVTFIGFLAAPLVALANQLVITHRNVPGSHQPNRWLLRWNLLAIVLLTLATVGFLYLRLLAA